MTSQTAAVDFKPLLCILIPLEESIPGLELSQFFTFSSTDAKTFHFCLTGSRPFLSLPCRTDAASVLQLPARDGASQGQYGVLQLSACVSVCVLYVLVEFVCV